MSLALVLRLSFRPGEPPVLALVLALQWLQVALQVLYANTLGVPVWQTTLAPRIEAAVALSLGWVVVVAFGTRLALRNEPTFRTRLDDVPGHAVPRLVVAYVVYYLATIGLALIPYSGLRQIVGTASNLRMAFVLMLLLLAVAKVKNARLAWGVFAFELLTGFMGFFASFKVPLLLLLLAYLGDTRRVTLRHLWGAGAVGAVTIGLGIVWTAVKPQYRDALNQGTGEQVVLIDRGTRLEALTALASELDARDFDRGARDLVARIAYVEYFGFVLEYVPRIQEHEDGRLWGAAVRHIFYPRVLFPDKPALELDTVVTERYTGLPLGSHNRNTSISIGIPGESYVDLGRVFMFVPALLVGLLYGFTYRALIRLPSETVVPLGLAAAVLIEQINIGITPAKLLGGYLIMFGGALALWYTLGFRIARWAFAPVANR